MDADHHPDGPNFNMHFLIATEVGGMDMLKYRYHILPNQQLLPYSYQAMADNWYIHNELV